MEITISQERGSAAVAVIHITGHLDGQSYMGLIAEARKVIEDGVTNILLDLSDLVYISSAGLVALHTIALMTRGEELPDLQQGWSTLRAMYKKTEVGVQKHLKLLSPRPEVVSVLDMVGFASFFEIFTDKRSAIDSF